MSTDPDRWFHGRITRENAARLLTTGLGGRREGLFLVRESLRMPGSFVLTLWARGQVHHFQILGHGDGWFSVDNGPLFQGLDELVHHYQIRPDGLPAQLHDFVLGGTPPLAARKRLETDLHRAVVTKDIGAVRRILASVKPGASSGVNSQSGDGSTPVHEAAKRGLCDMLELFLPHKPDFTVRDSKGSTALQVILITCICMYSHRYYTFRLRGHTEYSTHAMLVFSLYFPDPLILTFCLINFSP